DAFPEGREWAFLRISDPNDALPQGWTVDPDHSDYRLIIYGNDNGIRFAEWPRNNPGGTAGLSATVSEGGETNMVVLLSNLAPGRLVAEARGRGIAALIDVPEEYEDDIRITNVNAQRSVYNQESGRFFMYRIPERGWLFLPRSDKTGTWREAHNNTSQDVSPHVAGVLKIEVLTDGDREEEVIEITLRDEANPSSESRAWGSVGNVSDAGSPQVSTSTTFTLTIPSASIGFVEASSSASEGNTPSDIVLSLPSLERQITLALAVAGNATATDDYSLAVAGGSYDKSSGVLTIPARTKRVTFTVSAVNDTIADSGETVTFRLSERASPNALPEDLRLGDSVSHTVTITDGESKVGITQTGRVGTLNEPDTGQASTVSVPVGALGVNGTGGDATSAAALASLMTEDAVLQVSLYGAGFVGDQEVRPLDRNNPRNPDGSEDYTIGTLTIDKDTGTGSLDITIIEDAFPEGREWAFLRISDPNGALPPGWTVDPDHSDYRLIIYGNDNGIRFAEWPRNNPGGTAGLSATVSEGGETNMVVLLSNLAPGRLVAEARGRGIAALIDVPEEYEDDIRITNVNAQRSVYNQESGRFFMYRIPERGWLFLPRSDKTGTWREAHNNTSQDVSPHVAGVLKIEVLTDGDREEEVIEITLRDEANPSSESRAWGSVGNVSDAGSPQVSTSTTFTLRIPGANDNIFFELPDSEVIEGVSTTVDVVITPQLTAPASVLLNSPSSNVTITSSHYSNGVLTLPASTDKVTLTLETTKDTNTDDDTVTLTLSERQAPNALPASHEIGRSTHALTILEEPMITFGGGAPTNGIHARLNEPGTTSVMVDTVSNASASLLGELEGVVLDVVASLQAGSVNSDGTADFTIGTLTLDATGRGSFSFTVNDDSLTEADETVTLSLAESSASSIPLPPGWVLSEETYKILIETNDNAARFSEWPRNNPTYAQLEGEVIEGGNYVPISVLLTNPAPVDGLPIEIVVESGHEDDVAFRVVNNDHLDWDADTNILTVKAVSHAGSAALEVGALNDTNAEGSEVITITMQAASGFPSTWGTVANVADPGTPTSLTYTLTVKDHAARFAAWPRHNPTYAQLEGEVFEGGNYVPMIILLSQPPPAGGLPIEIAVESGHEGDVAFRVVNNDHLDWDADTNILTVKAVSHAGGAALEVGAPNDDLAEGSEEITITMQAASGFPFSWGTVANVADPGTPTSLTYTLTVNNNAARFAKWPRGSGTFARLAETITEGDSSSAANIVVLLTNPAPVGGLPIEIVMEGGNEDDVVFMNVNSNESTWNDTEKILRINHGRTAASLRITAVDNDDIEGTKVIPITMRQSTSGFPSDWGFDNLPDPGGTPTSQTYTLTITDDEESTIGFVEASSYVVAPARSGQTIRVPISMQVENYTISPTDRFKFDVTGTAGLSDASYNGVNLTTPLAVSLGATITSFNIDINHDATRTAPETIILTLRPGAGNLPPGMIPEGITRHTINIHPAGNNSVYFADHTFAVTPEEFGRKTLTIGLSAPATQPLPLRLLITGGNGLVYWENPIGHVRYPDNHIDITIPAYQRSFRIETVNLVLDARSLSETQNFATVTLMERENFPFAWGRVDDLNGGNIQTIHARPPDAH
ncbi:MAG: hypothetical protein OXF19_05435, partial [Hyphomicrobiales bacterium]|nr:hypothetical protein [Hyphomicrobiales bacterium]